jgi:hypothetical protein
VSRWALAAALAALAGCGTNPAAPPDTGAAAAARAFFEALARHDTKAAHDVLDDDSRARVSLDRFKPLADGWARQVGFPVERVTVTRCEEQGDDATARVELAGKAAGHGRRFKDAVTLKRRDGRWGVVLADTFGKPAR